jgi:transcription termination factor NusB
MRKRTQAREFALQILYQIDITSDSTDAALDNFWQSHLGEDIQDDLKQSGNYR